MICYIPETRFEHQTIYDRLTGCKINNDVWIDFIWCVERKLSRRLNKEVKVTQLLYDQKKLRGLNKPYEVSNIKLELLIC